MIDHSNISDWPEDSTQNETSEESILEEIDRALGNGDIGESHY